MGKSAQSVQFCVILQGIGKVDTARVFAWLIIEAFLSSLAIYNVVLGSV
jgi:hypothetical protein